MVKNSCGQSVHGALKLTVQVFGIWPGGCGQKWERQLFSSQGTKICSILRMSV